MQSIGNSLKVVKEKEDEKANMDEDQLFSELLAKQLRQLPGSIKLMVKMQINNIVYNHLIQSQGNHNQPFHDPMGHNNVFQKNLPEAYCRVWIFPSSIKFLDITVLGWVGCPTFEVKNPFELNYCQVYSTYSS
jgi:hypothetical protein